MAPPAKMLERYRVPKESVLDMLAFIRPCIPKTIASPVEHLREVCVLLA